MKNRHRERLRIAAKLFHRHKRGSRFEHGIIAPYAFDNPDPDRLTWWNDAVFIVNDYRVMLSWIHPRYAYDKMVRDEVERCMPQAEPAAFTIAQLTTKVGRSRRNKPQGSRVDLSGAGQAEARETLRRRLSRAADFRIAPFMRSSWTPMHRLVELCAPVEIRSRNDLVALTVLARRLLKREVSLDEAFPAYAYTRDDWLAETAD